MRNRGVRNPERNAAICGGIAFAGALCVWLGWRQMEALGHETNLTANLIAFGLLAAILGSFMFFNFFWAVRIFRAMRSGRTAIARWTVSADEFARFRRANLRERATDNDYKPPRSIPEGGVEVIFSEDGVLIGDTFFGLATTGVSRFDSVRMIPSDPPMMEFGTALTVITKISYVKVRHHPGKLRVPVATGAAAEAARVAGRFQDVVARRIIVKPNFWTWRIKVGLGIALFSSLAAAAGFALAERNQELGNVPLFLAVGGTIFALAGLILALFAWGFRRRQFHG